MGINLSIYNARSRSILYREYPSVHVNSIAANSAAIRQHAAEYAAGYVAECAALVPTFHKIIILLGYAVT